MNVCHIEKDAFGKSITISVKDSATGGRVSGFGTITLALNDLLNLVNNVPDGIDRHAKFQWFYWRDGAPGAGCQYMRAKVFMTDPEPDPTQGGTITPGG